MVVVLKKIEDAALLHQERDKIESSLAILDDVLALGVGGLSAVLKVLEAVILEDFLDDFGDCFLLKNLTIGGTSEKPGPGNDFGMVVAKTIIAGGGGKTADETVPVTLFIGRELNGKSHLLADNVFESNGMVFGNEFGGEMEEPRDALATEKAHEEQGVFAERCVELNEPIFLSEHCHGTLPSNQASRLPEPSFPVPSKKRRASQEKSATRECIPRTSAAR
jgi:hypothetical protein